MAFFLQYAPHSDFEQGIFVPFATQEEAELQAAADLIEGDPEFIVGIFEADYSTPKFGWLQSQLSEGVKMPHLDSDQRKKVLDLKGILAVAPKHQKRLAMDAAQGQYDYIMEVNNAIQEGRSFKNAVPGNAYSIMSGGTATAGAVALAAATAKTIVMGTSSTANQLAITEVGVSFDGVTASAVPVLVELVSGTATSTGTVTAQTPKQMRGWPSQTAQTTGQINATVEPTVQLVNRKWLVTPNGGIFVVQFPLGREPTGIVTATTDAKTWSLRVTAPAIVNVHAYLEFEE